MSSDLVVRVESVSKKFCRELKRSLWYGLADMAADLLVRPVQASLRPGEFWALDDVSLELHRGDCVGLIGRNGAGKTTLLKMLNGLIRPDHGRIEIHGRVGALIALGSGFNPILTGRENVYVNGSVLGLTTKEIDSKLEGIIDFADIGDFIDAPVQSYSSGMQVRLGFAVATALQPDLLLLDEVLAVGDAAFRAKCYDRLAHLREKAAFVLVSHDTDQIARVCSCVLLLEGGRVCHYGDVAEGVQRYHQMARQHTRFTPHEHTTDGVAASIVECDGAVAADGLLHITLAIRLEDAVPVADLRVVLWDVDGQPASDSYTRAQERSLRLGQGSSAIEMAIGPLRLKQGRYAVSVALLDRSSNRHLYWGEKIRTVDVNGPGAAAVPYAPAFRDLAVAPADDAPNHMSARRS